MLKMILLNLICSTYYRHWRTECWSDACIKCWHCDTYCYDTIFMLPKEMSQQSVTRWANHVLIR